MDDLATRWHALDTQTRRLLIGLVVLILGVAGLAVALISVLT